MLDAKVRQVETIIGTADTKDRQKTMLLAAGLSARRQHHTSVQRIWRAHGLQPHRVRQFKLSNDPKFVEKLRDVVGLH